MNTQRLTPRTDLYCGTHETHRINGKTIYQHAEELERELAHANEELLAGAKSENEAMRAAIQAAVTALRAWPKAGHGMSTDFTLQSQAFRSGQSALVALKPFLPETPTE